MAKAIVALTGADTVVITVIYDDSSCITTDNH